MSSKHRKINVAWLPTIRLAALLNEPNFKTQGGNFKMAS